jgi:hypothetical protein
MDCETTVQSVNGLQNNSTLRHLNLDRNHIGDEGMAALSKALTNNYIKQQRTVRIL